MHIYHNKKTYGEISNNIKEIQSDTVLDLDQYIYQDLDPDTDTQIK